MLKYKLLIVKRIYRIKNTIWEEKDEYSIEKWSFRSGKCRFLEIENGQLFGGWRRCVIGEKLFAPTDN